MRAKRILVGMTCAAALLSMACSDAGGVMRRDSGTGTPLADGGTITLPDGRVIRPDAGMVMPRPDGGVVVAGSIFVDVGWGHTCVMRTGSGQVLCWGANIAKQSGVDSDVRAVLMPNEIAGLTAETLSVGANHACAIIAGGSVKCFGTSSSGHLGNGGTDDSATPVDVPLTGVTQISAGGVFTCALHGGQVACWGGNTSGQLGLDPTDTSICNYSSLGGRECRSPEAFPGLEDVVSVHAGFTFGCARLVDGTVRCFGSGSSGQLGDGMSGCTPRPGPPGEMDCHQSYMPVEPMGLGAVEQVSAGGSHACALFADGTVKCWGRNTNGQLGDGTKEDRSTPVTVAGLSNVRYVGAGDAHTCALLADGSVVCWGRASDGETGQAGSDDLTAPQPVGGLADITQLAVDYHHTCAVSSTDDVYCWGSNRSGQLGSGSDMPDRSSTPVRVMGL